MANGQELRVQQKRDDEVQWTMEIESLRRE